MIILLYYFFWRPFLNEGYIQNILFLDHTQMQSTTPFELSIQFKDDDAIFTRALPTQNCWYDGHPLPSDSPPVTCPMKYRNKKTGVWSVTGKFCSWACVRRYNHEHLNDIYCTQRDMWIAVFAKEMQFIPLVCHIPMAQPRHRLVCYGGDLSIEEFRKCSTIIMQSNEFLSTVAKSKKNQPQKQITNTESNPILSRAFLMQECDIVQEDSCPLFDLYSFRHMKELEAANNNAKPQQLKIQPEQMRFIAHIHGEQNPYDNRLINNLPPIEVLRNRMRLPSIGDPSKMQPFNPYCERSVMEKSINNKRSSSHHHEDSSSINTSDTGPREKKRRGFFNNKNNAFVVQSSQSVPPLLLSSSSKNSSE
jgi:hypothetical protein